MASRVLVAVRVKVSPERGFSCAMRSGGESYWRRSRGGSKRAEGPRENSRRLVLFA